jgi:hypothetical protein
VSKSDNPSHWVLGLTREEDETKSHEAANRRHQQTEHRSASETHNHQIRGYHKSMWKGTLRTTGLRLPTLAVSANATELPTCSNRELVTIFCMTSVWPD